MPVRKTLEQAFREGVDVRGPDDCWPWTKGVDREGYGKIGRREDGGRTVMRGAHVVAFMLDRDHPPTHNVLHTCDNPPCCNPAHLYDGTCGDNARDRMAAGTVRNRPVLTFEQVLVIRTEHDGSIACTAVMARRYGVSTRSIANVVTGRTWRVGADGLLVPRRALAVR
jgi:hypothetical protein